MSDILKYIVSELNNEPFKKSYNLISFDSLEPLQLLQVLTDVLTEVDPKHKLDVREEAPDQTAIRVFSTLRILKYKPPTEANNLSAFRQGLVQGDKPIIYPIIEWILRRLPELKKRAYLARYLVRLEIPSDFIADDQIAELFQQYDQLMVEFKESHKTHEALKNSGFNTTDIKKDISSMEEEREQLVKRIDRLKRKVESQPNTAPMLAAARNLRTERDRESKILQQKTEQKNLIVQYEQRIQRLQQQLKDTRQASIGATPQGLIQRLEEENKVNSYMLKDKMPKELTGQKKGVKDLQQVVSEPAMGQSDLDDINQKIRNVNIEVNQLIEKRMMSNDPIDDKMSLFRQQAAIIARKKENAAEALRDARDECARSESEADDKRAHVKEADGGETLKGEDGVPGWLRKMSMYDEMTSWDKFKRYVNKLRTKSTTYKKKRGELAELRAELGVLSRSEEILKTKDNMINQTMNMMEAKQGVAGYRQTQDALESVSSLKAELDQMKGRTLEDMSFMVQKLTKKIQEKKSALAPIIKELRPLRQRAQELQQEYDEKKGAYDTTSAGLESNRSKLEQEVRVLREECNAEESRYHYVNAMKKMIELQQKKVQDEMRAYVSSDPQEKKKAYREQYSRKVQEQENLGKGLREKQRYIKENQEPHLEQMRQWKDFERLMEMKLGLGVSGSGQGAEPARSKSDGVAFSTGPDTVYDDEDRLVL